MQLTRSNPIFCVVALGTVICGTRDLSACPFCNATSQTLSEELAAAQISVIARLSKPAESSDAGVSDPATGMAKFEIVEFLRGADNARDLKEIEVVYFGEEQPDKLFLINGIASGLSPGESGLAVDWTTPLPLSERGVEYVKQLETLPADGEDRYSFFLKYFEDPDPLLAQDAYDEFARAPYKEVIELGPHLDRDQLMKWIEDPLIGPTRRRLYLTLLAICGKPADADKLEAMLKYDYRQMAPVLDAAQGLMSVRGSGLGGQLVGDIVEADVRRQQQCLDALVAAYLKLKGPDGMTLIEEKFLTNPQADYSQVYATIMALRFHGEETTDIPRERLLEAVRLALDNPDVCDQVIPDLARWEDWSVLERLVQMFKESEKDAWIRQPAISYVLTAAEQSGDVGKRANQALAEIEAIDPEGVKRARSYMDFAFRPRTASTAASPGPEEIEDAEPMPVLTAKEPGPVAAVDAAPSGAAPVGAVVAVPSRTTLIVAPLAACVILMVLFALLLRGADVRGPGDAN